MSREPLLRPVLGASVLAFGALAMWFLAIDTQNTQTGFRGTGMVDVKNADVEAKLKAANVAPEALPEESAEGPKASENYQNVQVLGHLSDAQFLRIMTSITEWVSPEQGCNYCHVADADGNVNFASDDNYAKVVSRRMFQMTQHINANWDKHVGQTGVTCYTCHRGNPVPENIWFNDPAHPQMGRALGDPHGQNQAGVEVAAFSSLPADPLSRFLEKDAPIRVIDKQPIVQEQPKVSIQDTEWTYSLMMHMSTSLGVNCTYCHNSRAFGEWEQSTAQRTTAWHGIRMVRDINGDYLNPLKPVYPAERLGPTGDAPKANCTTCHQGVNKPLYGAAMLKDYLASLGSPKN